ncbi:hypothetical protein F3Y22_tig00110597pilonHSYRG01147 [Hibiscus syriacus]|uniref:Uncharacterized protein n=1 Tax=Hibiscus syriacus TaxID=106335 RepID=A0A6A3A775_HIBSY|nr:hypothetical protein F3Y22_tig00110597pilonHSYRG01147 [Hibiscus syriacus]
MSSDCQRWSWDPRNTTSMLQIGFALATRPDAYWIQLRQKYKVTETCPATISRSSCSPLWLGLSKAWPSLRKCLAWSVGNGTLINFWDDVWLPSLGSLRPYALSQNSIDTSLKTSHMIPQRIRFFLWLALKEKPMTNLERCKRSLTYDPSCRICGCAEESILHILRDCNMARSLWNQIWKQRNEMVFTADSNSREVVLHCSIAWARHFESSPTINTPVHQNTHDQGHWKPPPAGWFCLNTDGGVATHSGDGSIGGVLRDSSGSWLGSFAKNIGVSTLLQAELWTIYVGLQVAWDYGLEILQIQTDNKQVVHLLDDHNAITSSLSLVRAIINMRKRAWITDILWIPCEENQVADKLTTKTAPPHHFQLVIHDTPHLQNRRAF